MINDELVWQSLNQTFCSYKSKVDTHNFCRHQMNVTGLCNKSACPLANGRYATIREEDGKCYLYIKEPERAHTPAKLWIKTLLPKNYTTALNIVTEKLQFFPKFLQHRTKQRLTRIHQYLIRMRKLALKTHKPKLVGIKKKVERREDRKEVKALAAAKLNESIQQELLARLKQGTYGDIYNFPALQYNQALDEAQTNEPSVQVDREEEDDRLLEEFVEGDFDDDMEDFDSSPLDDEPNIDLLDTKKRKLPSKDDDNLLLSTTPTTTTKSKKSSSNKKSKRRIEIEYDDEDLLLESPLAV
mmetsp:Transcript_23439/g.30433  ORF Transcript_23439/g.30433 Transcript_23439/m.30433 type:complete len:299 (+) Transcript_23439:81-977(+)